MSNANRISHQNPYQSMYAQDPVEPFVDPYSDFPEEPFVDPYADFSKEPFVDSYSVFLEDEGELYGPYPGPSEFEVRTTRLGQMRNFISSLPGKAKEQAHKFVDYFDFAKQQTVEKMNRAISASQKATKQMKKNSSKSIREKIKALFDFIDEKQDSVIDSIATTLSLFIKIITKIIAGAVIFYVLGHATPLREELPHFYLFVDLVLDIFDDICKSIFNL